MSDEQRAVLCDPQTSGGLLIAVKPEAVEQAKAAAEKHGIELFKIGRLFEKQKTDNTIIQVI